jgi:hypothetical protein
VVAAAAGNLQIMNASFDEDLVKEVKATFQILPLQSEETISHHPQSTIGLFLQPRKTQTIVPRLPFDLKKSQSRRIGKRKRSKIYPEACPNLTVCGLEMLAMQLDHVRIDK